MRSPICVLPSSTPTLSLFPSALSRSSTSPLISTSLLHFSHHHNHLLTFFSLYPSYLPSPSPSSLASYPLRLRLLSLEFRHQVLSKLSKNHSPSIIPTHLPISTQLSLTHSLLNSKAPFILNPALLHSPTNLLARPHALVRADVAHTLFGLNVDAYVVVATRRSQISTHPDGKIARKGKGAAVSMEMCVWKELLAELAADTGVMLARDNKQRLSIAYVDLKQNALRDKTRDAIHWLISVAQHGQTYIQNAMEKQGITEHSRGIEALAKLASDFRFRPNMKVSPVYDYPWADIKRNLALTLREITLISGLGRINAHSWMEAGGVNDFHHPTVTASNLDPTGKHTHHILQVNKQSYQGHPVLPHNIAHNNYNWRRLAHSNKDHPQLENNQLPYADERTFYVDFELAPPDALFTKETLERTDDLRAFEKQGIEPNWSFDMASNVGTKIQKDCHVTARIFMAGCGQLINGTWQYKVFVANNISSDGERQVVMKLLKYMHEKNPTSNEPPLMNVWGPEERLLRKAISRMQNEEKEQIKDVMNVQVVNMLQVALTGGVVVKGALSHSLKEMSMALERLGLLEEFEGVEWGKMERGLTNGVDALGEALLCAEHVYMNGLERLEQAPNMNNVIKYNELDCLDIARIATYLRKHH